MNPRSRKSSFDGNIAFSLLLTTEKYFGANRLQPETAASEDPLELQFSRKIADVETRQHRRLSCLEREAEHTERLRNLKQAQAFERHLAGELHQRRVQDALARRYYDQHVQQLRARKLAQKAHEERVSLLPSLWSMRLLSWSVLSGIPRIGFDEWNVSWQFSAWGPQSQCRGAAAGWESNPERLCGLRTS